LVNMGCQSLWSNVKSTQNMRNSLLWLHIHIAKKLAEAFRWGLCKLSLDPNIVIKRLFNANAMLFTKLFVFLKLFTELMRFTVLLHLSLMFTYKARNFRLHFIRSIAPKFFCPWKKASRRLRTVTDLRLPFGLL